MTCPQVTKNLRDAVLKIKDGTTPTALEIEVVLDEGDLSADETLNTMNILDRGSLDHMRPGDEEPVKVTFTTKFVEYRQQAGAPDPTPYEALKKIGGAASWVSTNQCGEVYCVDLEFTIASPTSGEVDEVITFPDFHPNTISFKEGDEYNTLAVDGEAFVTAPTIVKS
jgi:hypothetical protein